MYIIWYIIAFSIYFLFILLTPIDLCKNHSLLISFTAGITCAIFILLGVLRLNNFRDIFFYDFKSDSKISTALQPVLMLMIGPIILALVFSARIDTTLMRNGILTEGQIRNKKIEKTIDPRSSPTYSLDISFRSKTGARYTFREKVSLELFNSVFNGMNVEVKYMEKDPSIFRIIAGNSNVSKFVKETTNRHMVFSDLEKIYFMPRDSVKGYLDSVSYKWEKRTGTGVVIYNNRLKKERLTIRNNGSITFKSTATIQSQHFIPRDQVLETTSQYKGAQRNKVEIYKTKDFIIIDSLIIDDRLKVNQYLIMTAKE